MRKARMYGLFEQQGWKEDAKWVRLYPTVAYRKDVAVRLFQNALLAPYFGDVCSKEVKGMRKLAVVAETVIEG